MKIVGQNGMFIRFINIINRYKNEFVKGNAKTVGCQKEFKVYRKCAVV